jgi:protein SCO1
LDRLNRVTVGLEVVTYRSGMATVRRRQHVGLTLAGAAVFLASACGSSPSASGNVPVGGDTVASEGAAIYGGFLQPANIEPATTLTDTSGQSYNIKARNAGKVTLVYFGYTHCPDVCPTTMADIAEALRQSSPAVRHDVTVVFVTVDPTRDTLPVLRHWLNGFSPTFVGLRGTLAQVIAAQRAANLPVSKVSKDGKSVEHSAEVLTYTPDGEAHVIYNEGPSTISDLTHDLPILVHDRGFE